MFFAIAALLMQPQVVPQLSFSTEKIAVIHPAVPATLSDAPASEPAAVIASAAVAETSAQPTPELSRASLPDAPVPAPSFTSPGPKALIIVKPTKKMTVTVGELLAENRRNQRLWRGLIIASSGAATFDAWSTRHALTTSGAQELNPMLKPFAGNASLYAVIQVGPALMDYAGRKMMYSSHSWVRHLWWAPQTASFVSSMFCGAHNLAVH